MKGVKIIIVCRDEILLFHRDNNSQIPFPDHWHFVGGRIEDGETPEEAIIRETQEEVGYKLNNFKLIDNGVGHFAEEIWIYLAEVNKKEKSLFKKGKDEGQEIGWFNLKEALKLKLTPGAIDTLTKHQNIIETVMKKNEQIN